MTTDEQALSQIVAKLEEAWNAGDSAAFASYFTDDATFIHIFGGQLDGRTAIQAIHRQIFDTIYKGSRLQGQPKSLHPVADSVPPPRRGHGFCPRTPEIQ